MGGSFKSLKKNLKSNVLLWSYNNCLCLDLGSPFVLESLRGVQKAGEACFRLCGLLASDPSHPTLPGPIPSYPPPPSQSSPPCSLWAEETVPG